MILSSQTLEVPLVDWFGVALVLLGLTLFLVDLKATNHGAPAIGGLVALVSGVLVLFDAASPYPWASMAMLVVVVVIVAALLAGVFGAALLSGERPATTGVEGMIGEVGVVRVPVGTGAEGWVFVRGELWRAVAAVAPEDVHEQGREPFIGIGGKVEVIDVEDGKIVVLPLLSVES